MENVEELRQELALLRREFQSRQLAERRKTSRMRWAAAALVFSGFTYVGGAFAQESCDAEGDLPEPLYTFCPGQAANAFDVNWNFRSLANQIIFVEADLDTKLDKDLSGGLSIPSTRQAGVGTDGALVVGPTDAASITFDGNEIISRNNGVASSLYINGGGHDAKTAIQDSGGHVVIGAGGDETRLYVKGNVDVDGTLNRNCPTDTSRIGDSCIENSINGAASFFVAISTCHAKERHVCSSMEYAMCDRLQPSGSTCTATTDDSAYSMWTSDMRSGASAWTATRWNGSGNSGDTVSDYGAGNTADYYCCEYL